MSERRLFIAGSTGAVGRTVLRLCDARGVDAVPHVRPKTAARAATLHPRAAVLELSDAKALTQALEGRTTVLQLVGTMRKRFAQGDTYQSSDVGTTRHLVEAARRAGSIDHLILLSSVGAGRPWGSYLQAKAEAEALVRNSGIPFTVFRPSSFEGEGHRAPPLVGPLTRALRLDRLRPIAVESLAGTLVQVALDRAPLEAVLEGRALWEVVERGSEAEGRDGRVR